MRLGWMLSTGALIAASFVAVAGEYAPLDCGKAESAAAKTICKSYNLGQAEARMATLYAIATSLVPMGRRGDIEDQQRGWLKTRAACGDRVPCLEAAYAARIRELSGVIADVASRGPF